MLKDYYTDEDPDQSIDVNVKLIDEIERTPGGADADGFRITDIAKVQENTSTITTAFTNSLEPTAGNRSYQRYIVQPAYIKASSQFDQQLVQMSKTDKGAFVKELDSMIKDLRNNVRKDMARQINGDGTGKIAELTADVAPGAGVTIFLHDITSIQAGQNLAVFTKAGAFVEAIQVITIDPQTNTITANTVNPFLSLYFVTKGESAALNALNSEMLGVRAAIANTGTYININRTTFPVWQSATSGLNFNTVSRPQLFSEGNGNVVVSNILKRVSKKDDKGNTKAFDFVMTDFESYNYIVSLQTQNRRFVDNVNYKIGVGTLAFNDNIVERDAFCSKEHAAIGRVTVYVAGAPDTVTLDVAPNAILTTADKLEIYRGNTCIGQWSGLTAIGGVTFQGTFTAFNAAVPAVGDVVYFDNNDAGAVANTAPRVFNNLYFINPEYWRMGMWQDVQNLNEAINGISFEKVSGATQFKMTLTGMMQPYTVRPNAQGRYRFTIPQDVNSNGIPVF